MRNKQKVYHLYTGVLCENDLIETRGIFTDICALRVAYIELYEEYEHEGHEYMRPFVTVYELDRFIPDKELNPYDVDCLSIEEIV